MWVKGSATFSVIPISSPYTITLDDQTQVDSKPAGQHEHASLNQCQLIAP